MPIQYIEPGKYCRVRISDTQLDVYYGTKGDFPGRGHLVVSGGEVVCDRAAFGIPMNVTKGQTVELSGLTLMVSGGSLLLAQQQLNTSATSL